MVVLCSRKAFRAEDNLFTERALAWAATVRAVCCAVLTLWTIPGLDRTHLHRLDDIVAIAILAVICAAGGWTDLEEFGKSKHD